MNTTTILEAMKWRYATKIYDSSKAVSEEDLHTILEAGRLSPSVYGLEPWEFIVVKNPELRTKLRAAAYDQPKVTDATYLIVIATRTDTTNVVNELIERTAKNQGKTVEDLKGFSDMVHGTASQYGDGAKEWLMRQTYIPLGVMIETAALMSIDSGPMEGFNSDQVDEILGLKEKNLRATTMLALGYRGDDAYAKLPKTRKSADEAITIVN